MATKLYEDSDAVLFLTFDVYAEPGKARKVRRQAERGIESVVERALEELVELGFPNAFCRVDVRVKEV